MARKWRQRGEDYLASSLLLALELLHLPHKAEGVVEAPAVPLLAVELLHLPHKAAGVDPNIRDGQDQTKTRDAVLDQEPSGR